MIDAEAFDLVQGQENFQQEHFVLLLERKGEPVDNAAQNLQKFGDPVVMLRFVNKLRKGQRPKGKARNCIYIFWILGRTG